MRVSCFPGKPWLRAGPKSDTPSCPAQRHVPGSARVRLSSAPGRMAWGARVGTHRCSVPGEKIKIKKMKAVSGLLSEKIHQQVHAMRDMGIFFARQPRSDTSSCRWFQLEQGPKGRAKVHRDRGVEQALVRCDWLDLSGFYLIKSSRNPATQNSWPPVFCKRC